MQQSTNIFQGLQTLIERQVNAERLIMGGLALGAIACTFSPVLIPQQDKVTKLLQMLYGVTSGAAFTSCAYLRQKKERLYQSLSDAQNLMLKEGLKSELTFNTATQRMEAQRELAAYIAQKPLHEQQRWIVMFGLQGILPSVTVDAPTSPSVPGWVSSNASPESVEYEPEPDPVANMDWIYALVEEMAEIDPDRRKHHHLKIDGGSQSGKSTLFSCILDLLNQAIAHNGSKLVTNLIDPKYPKTRWTIKPSFIGFEQVKAGVETAIKALDIRKKQCVEAEEKGISHPDFPRYVLIIDEWDSIWGEGKGYGDIIPKDDAVEIRSMTLRILKEAAAYNFTLVIIGQSPLSTTNGFSRSDLNSATRLVVGNEALKWVQDPGFPFKVIAPDLQSDLNYWIGKDARCCVCIPNVGQPFVEAIPKIKAGASEKQREKQSPQPSTDWLEEIKQWLNAQLQLPNREQVRAKWEELTGKQLNDRGLEYLLKELGLD
jgi:hypothetical protein